MKKVTINNQVLPALGIGTWEIGDDPKLRDEEIAAIRAGLDAGLSVIDTAEMYGNGRSEELVGEAIKPYQRAKIFLISKVLPQNASRSKMRQSLQNSLQRLQTDYLDLYLYHWRGMVPLSETVSELQALQNEGLIRSWGVSNFDIDDMEELWQLPEGQNCVVNEDLYNLETRGIEYSLLPWQREHHVPLIAYSPLGRGPKMGSTMMKNEAVLQVAEKHEASAYQILLAWVMQQPDVLAIPKSSSSKHLLSNLKALDIELTPEDLQILEKAYPKPEHKEPLAIY
ncbi:MULTISPECIES: aldo/keto reductase [unclassified Lactobacillus]|uniref:aldo/keto reductase n=1 Tax=unclassified Lactobacillus TaxID=2620435 RepID=UPI0018DDA80B|nr:MULTISPECIES: aldo/keto reductase [unclassified Lactobacillus]MBH9990018.1 aldo/keto reductase [Lactobacillus sp. M0392]MBI0024322.1 aldo/keto reductase [Lactobacillus sp. W8171]MBI0044964.1 aldo/keto reductase [Lactobacillus sp. M0393]